LALQILHKVPVLWIWDNVEPITGFPAGTKSDWGVEEQQELLGFLNAARETKAKFLLTSRRDEDSWLGNLPRRVPVPPMPMQERLQLAGAVVEHRGKRLVDLPDLKPLLRFTQGNPLTILVTVGEALRVGVDTKDRLDAFVATLRSGEAAFEDEETEGRSKSLGASLSYGFGHAFGEDESKILALLHLFQGFVDVDALCLMGNPGVEWSLEAVRGVTREQGMALLNRAAEVGLLDASGGGYYGIHPALPWYFRDLFERYYPGEAEEATRHAFVEAMGGLGDLYHNRYYEGHRDSLAVIAAEEENLLAAWRIAREHGWWPRIIGTMQGLRTLYSNTGRGTAWRRLVESVVRHFVDPTTEGPRAGLEEQWSLVTEYRVRLAKEERNWTEAERLQRACVEWDRKRAQPALECEAEKRDRPQRHDIRTLAVSVHELAQSQRVNGDPACVGAYREALDLATAIGDKALEGNCVFNLGRAYMEIVALRDLDEAERWFRRSLDQWAPSDSLGRGKSLGQLGAVAFERFLEPRTAKPPTEELARHLAEAAQLYEQALTMFPKTDIVSLGITHNQLGIIYRAQGNIDRALHHFQRDIRYCETAGDVFGAGQTRRNVALALLEAGRLDDARAYAEAALANYQTFGERAADNIRDIQQLFTVVNEAQAKQRGGK
jgi:tetratricopeptide (TPR) repeat protein